MLVLILISPGWGEEGAGRKSHQFSMECAVMYPVQEWTKHSHIQNETIGTVHQFAFS